MFCRWAADVDGRVRLPRHASGDPLWKMTAAPGDHGLFLMCWIPRGDGRGDCPGKFLVRLVSILEAAVFEQALGCERVQHIQFLLPIRTVSIESNTAQSQTYI